ncbi:hypothetical protein BaRGS_00018099 [Batillaria attramentaria]|uniref:Centromere protein M n=1 Tax=Batillaria attramentaria TaxID=370345 RepID=A0ABD0KE87_9CAEN
MASDDRTLTPYNVLPNRQEASLLVVGAEGVGKHDLSLAVLKIPVQFSLQIRTASSLPLPTENADLRPRIDFICFIMSMTDRESIQVVEKSLSLVDVKYFLGRACLVVTGVHSHKKMTDLDQVTALADSFNLPLVFGEVKSEKERDQLARRILTMTEVAAGFKNHVSPLLVESTRLVTTS